jgi:hypothetical protein
VSRPGVRRAAAVFWVGVALEWAGIAGMLWRWRKGVV